MRSRCRGQSTAEYMLLLCSTVTLASLAGAALQKYLPTLAQWAFDITMQAAWDLAKPY